MMQSEDGPLVAQQEQSGACGGRGRGRGRGPGRGRGRGIRVPVRKRLSKRARKSKPDNPLQVRLLW